MRYRVVVAGMIAVVAVAMTAAPARADNSTVTFEVAAADGLGISVPASASLGSESPGATISAQLGAFTVSDQRASLSPAWTVTVSATAFTTGDETSAETIAATAVSYWSGPATATVGTGTFTPGQAAVGNAVTLNATRTAFAHTGGAGSNSATWNPTVVVAVPAQAVAGTYTGTVTHSVS